MTSARKAWRWKFVVFLAKLPRLESRASSLIRRIRDGYESRDVVLPGRFRAHYPIVKPIQNLP